MEDSMRGKQSPQRSSPTSAKRNVLEPVYLRPAEAAIYLGVSVRTLNRLVQKGKLNRRKPTGARRGVTLYARAELDALPGVG